MNSHKASVDSLEDSLKSTGASLFLKATGRETKPAWGNRIVKDSYDLYYDVPGDIGKMAEKFIKLPNKKHPLGTQGRKDKREDLIINNHSEKVANRRKAKPKPQDPSPSRKNQEKIQIGSLQADKSDSLGLCPFQYQKTIQGKIKSRADHHLSFDKNRVNRTTFENPVYYNRHQDIDLSRSKSIERKKAIGMLHSFQSYTDRCTFQPRDELDKIFDTDNGLKIATPRRNPEAILKFDSVVERRDSRLNESAVLSYEYAPATDMVKRKSISYSIREKAREMQFYPQVISDRRGCYR